MINKTLIVIFLGLSGIFGACVDRERLNPLDVNNPETNGRPTGFRLSAIDDTVFLRWQLLGLDDLTGYKIEKKSGTTSDFMILATVPSDLNTFADENVQFGTEYTYRLSAVGATFESRFSDVLAIEPGPTTNWVSDNFNRRLYRLTHDARHEIDSIGGFTQITDIEANPITGDIWLIDRVNAIFGQVLRVSSQGEVVAPTLNFTSPIDISVDFDSQDVWIADNRDSVVYKYNTSGELLLRTERFTRPSALSVDQRNGSCWVADNQSNRITRISADGTDFFEAPIITGQIASIDVNTMDGSVWITEPSNVRKLSEFGQSILDIDAVFGSVNGLAVNQTTGEVWVIGSSPSGLKKFSASGELIFEIDDLSDPRDLSINLFDDSCLIADTGNRRLIRVASDGGEIIMFAGDLVFPDAVEVLNDTP